MSQFSYRDRDYSFGQAMLTLRSAIGLTQSELADLLGVSRRAVGAWEAGSKYPKADHLKQFIALAIQHQAFPSGREAEEVRALWQAARQRVLLNESWLSSLLAPQSETAVTPQKSSINQAKGQQNAVFNLPPQATPFVGRVLELTEITRLMGDPACRLLTLLGPGGIGKTRLALATAANQIDSYSDGVVFVPLASIGTPNQIVSAVSEALDLSFGGQSDPAAHLLDYLSERQVLLVLDNFEHVLDGADLVYDILQQASLVTILVTSRARLDLQAEWLFDVEGLSYPALDALVTPQRTADLAGYSAVQLFVQRVAQVQSGFPPPESSLGTIVRVCQHVAGMPLAIELAAANVRTQSIEEIEQQIRSNLDVLKTTLRDVPARHRSMRAVFDHSWNLLSEPERALLSRLAIFRGGCSIDAAQQVTGSSLSALMSLVDKSLLRQVSAAPDTKIDPRFFLLEPIREYALEKLSFRGELELLQRAHASYYLQSAETVMANWDVPAADPAIEQINRDLNNIRAAMRWAGDSGQVTIGLQLAGVLWRFWRSGGYTSEGRGWLDELLALRIPDQDTAAMSAQLLAMHAAAWLASDQHDYARATYLFEQSVTLRRTLGGTEADTHMLHNLALQARATGDYQQATHFLEEALARNRALSTGGLGQSLYEMGFSLYGLGLLNRERGEYPPAVALFEESLVFHREIGDRESMAQAMLGLGDVARDQGHAAQNRAYTEQSLAIYREFGTQWAIGFALNNLAQAAYIVGDMRQALGFANESITLFRAIQNEGGTAETLVTLGHILTAQGDTAGATEALSEALRIAWIIGPRLLVVASVEALAVLMAQSGQPVQAVRLFSATTAARQQMGTPLRPADQPATARAIENTHADLGEKQFETLWTEAQNAPLDQLLNDIFDTDTFSAPMQVVDVPIPPPQPIPIPEVPAPTTAINVTSAAPSVIESGTRLDWGDALAVPSFYGREWELDMLRGWIIDEHCRVVSMLGMGGIGKSSLAVTLMHQLASQFDVVIWRSLRDIPVCDVLLDQLLQVLAPRELGELRGQFEQCLTLLLDRMRSTRVLIVLDNLESVLEDGETAGRMRPGYEGFGQFLRKAAQTEHQSTVLLTSREKPVDLIPLEGSRAPVRALRLARLDAVSSEKLLEERGVTGTLSDQARLIEAYTGNPLALKIVSQTIVDLFDGEIAPFLEQGEVIFGSVRELLNQQFVRLSALEQRVLLWLAILREPSTLDELLTVLAVPVPRVKLLEAIEALRRRSLIERGNQRGSVTLQSVVLEYMTARIITEASDEIQSGNLAHITLEHGFELAQTREYVREIQMRLIVKPILAQLHYIYSQQTALEQHLLGLLKQLALQADHTQGYGAANLITLLRLLRGNLRGLDLAGLVVRGVYFQGVEMQDASLSGSMIRDSVFNQTFDALSSVAVSSTGIYWATGSRHGEVRMWTEGGTTLHRVWRAHADMVNEMQFSPDGTLLATAGSWDGQVKLWNVASGALLWSVKHLSQANGLTFSPDGNLLTSSGYDAHVYLWDMRTNTPLHVLAHPDVVTAITWSPDGRFVVTGDLKGCIRWWSINGNEPVTCTLTLDEHTNCVEGLAFSPDGSTLASASWDNTVKLWNVADGSNWQTLIGHTNRVTRVAWSPDGHTLVSAGRDRTIWLWDRDQDKYRVALHGHSAGVQGLTFTPDNDKVLTVSEDGALRVCKVSDGQSLRLMQGYVASLNDVDWSPDGTQLVSGGSNTLVTIYAVNGRTEPRIFYGHLGIVIGSVWSPDGRWIASSEWNNAVRLWDATSGECVRVLGYPDETGDYFDRLAWSPDGQHLAIGTYKHGIQLFDTRAQQQSWIGSQISTWIRHVAWNPDGIQLAGGGADGAVYVWDTSTATQLQRLTGHHSTITDVAWSPSGRLLASASRGTDGGEVFVWDAESGERVLALQGHPLLVYAVTWGSSEDVLITADADGTLRWWNLTSGACFVVHETHQGAIHSLRRSPDGTMLASCGNDGAIMLWDIDSGEYMQTLRRDRPYERLNITGIKGLTQAQKMTLLTLGAVEMDSA